MEGYKYLKWSYIDGVFHLEAWLKGTAGSASNSGTDSQQYGSCYNGVGIWNFEYCVCIFNSVAECYICMYWLPESKNGCRLQQSRSGKDWKDSLYYRACISDCALDREYCDGFCIKVNGGR